jgi:Flp pilus assembly protein protease CpaA
MLVQRISQWLPAPMNTLQFVLMTVELILVAYLDLKIKKISNLWSVLNLVIAVILWPLGVLGAWDIEVLIFPVAFVVIGFFLFQWKIMGAGDSKFLATLFLCLPLSYHLIYFERLLTATMMVGFILLMTRIFHDPQRFKSYFLSRHWSGIRDMIRSRFSYAPVMLLAWLLLGAALWF